VIGAGVIGLSVALSLARKGVAVTVLERELSTGQGTSAAAAGMLASAAAEAGSPGAFFDLCRQSSALWPQWAEMLSDSSGVDCELELSGLLRVTTSAASTIDLEIRRAWQLAQGMEVSELLNPDQLRREVPGLGPEVVAGLLYPSEGHVHSHRVLSALEGACRALGVRILTGVTVTWVRPEGIPSVEVSGGEQTELSADHLVVAAGAWSGPLLSGLGVTTTVEPIRGQIVAAFPQTRVLPRIVYGDSGYVLQKRSGLLLAGATEEQAGFQPWPTLEGLQQVTADARRLMPGLGLARFFHTWAGLRPFSKGGPLLGRVPASERVLLATGHHRNGILLAPVTGELLSRAIVEGGDPPELAPFSPQRAR
jgi:glycine oxidase